MLNEAVRLTTSAPNLLRSNPRVDPLLAADVRIAAVGMATPPEKYTQKEIPDLFAFTHPTVKKFFSYDHIQSRHLFAPPRDPMTGHPIEESYGDLLKKFERGALEIGGQALADALAARGLKTSDIDYLACVTSTGFIIPGLSALFIKHFGLRTDCQRADIVGMGCNAGLNGLNAITGWSLMNPGRVGVLLCVEICSAIYSIDDTPRTAIVNSLFGDGAVACVIENNPVQALRLKSAAARAPHARLLGFESQLIPESSDQLRFEWDETKKRYSFFVGKDTPRATAAVADQPVRRLLERFQLAQADIQHWVIHGGGNAILTGMQNKLGLEAQALRHTRSVLRDFGNVSSASFLFSYSRLMQEGLVRAGDLGLLMTMGPGLTVETALVRWE